MSLTLLPLLRRHDDHTCHSTCTVDRGSGSILEDLEALDVIGVKPCDSGADEGLGVTGGEVISTYVGDVLHDHTVYHPEWLRAPVDRGSTTDTDLRSGAEGATDVLYRDPGGLPL